MLLFHCLKGTREILYDKCFSNPKPASRQRNYEKVYFSSDFDYAEKAFLNIGYFMASEMRNDLFRYQKRSPLTSTCGIICCSCCCVMF